MTDRRYRLDFTAMMRSYESNYAKLCPLLPRSNRVGDECGYQVFDHVYCVKIVEVTKYTTIVDICQTDANPSLPLPKLTVRLYHDARVAEVCASQQISQIKPRYDYPNSRMLQKDEKHQVNQFLSDWLTFCIKNGVSHTPII
ncbi:DUF1249 family protein [Vibrio sp. Of7-15]|uniref:DUF1249 family protein n=1 Tax=Vibrio sp. Of7-15 TaxID=2724879 RepID=UPI001EF186D8|nr:DUF1249 family protein [Vibrio sp. Of7-15]MCG7498208.1 DUF1249 family protein [Vibrio sp. Of7-15]